MMFFFRFLLLTVYVTSLKSSIYGGIKDNVISFLKDAMVIVPENEKGGFRNTGKPIYGAVLGNKEIKNRAKDITDMKVAKHKAKVLEKARMLEKNLNEIDGVIDESLGSKQRYHMDPVLNKLRRNSHKEFKDARRAKIPTDSSDSSSSSLELPKWKDEWQIHWMKKKIEAANTSTPRGDFVNMVAARPWGVPCGDPNQHDMPWGTCTLPSECEGEYRIYRGDYFCGRTQFVCCAIQLHTYDMNQGFDMSFGSSVETDSEEKRNRDRNSKERKHKRRQRAKRKRRRNRLRRKRKIKRNLKKIVKEIKKILNRSYRNGTTARKKKTKELKKFIKHLKKKYKKDRQAVKDIHEFEITKIDESLQKKLNQIRDMNKNFISNSTFRDIIINGTITKQGARMLIEAYPELVEYLNVDTTRRSGKVNKPDDYLEYDIEYGLLYY